MKKENKGQLKSSAKGKTQTELNPNKGFSLPAVFIAIGIAIVTYIVFSPSLKCSFTNWDDPSYVLENPLVASNSVPLKNIFQTPVALNYHPLTILTLAWNNQSGKLDPKEYHSWNVWLHVLNTLLVFIFIFLLTQRNLLMAFIVSLFFGIHPMHVESVTWISERKDVLYAFFFLTGLIAYLNYHKSKKRIWYFVTLISFVMSCLSKAMAVVFPIVLLLVDYFLKEIPVLSREGNKKTAWWKRKIIIEKIPFFLISLGFGFAAFKIQHDEMAMTNMQLFSSFQRIGFASYGAMMYVVRMFLPVNLSAIYPYPKTNAIPVIFYLSPFILIGLTAAIFLFLRKEKAVVFGLLFYFVSVALVLQFVSVGNAIMADRYSYLSYIGLLFVVAHLVDLSWRKKINMLTSFRYPIAVLLFIGATAFCYQTYARTQVWMNSETLWTDAINKYPEECYVGYNHRGMMYYEQKIYDLAITDYNKALELNPYYANPYYNRGIIHDKNGQYDSAITDYNKNLELDSVNFKAYNNRGVIFSKRGQYDLAISDYNKASEINPVYVDVYYNRGATYLMHGKYDLAIADFSKAIVLKPSVPAYWIGRARAENVLGKKEEAKADVIKAQQLGMKVDSTFLKEFGIEK